MIEKSQRRRVSRIGVYGIIIKEDKVLLTLKPSGCYKGQLDLPGGGIEFGETPEEALIRELQEEIGMEVNSFKLLNNYAHNEKVEGDDPLDFHHLAQVYLIQNYEWISNAVPEEIFDWYSLQDVVKLKITPITTMALRNWC